MTQPLLLLRNLGLACALAGAVAAIGLGSRPAVAVTPVPDLPTLESLRGIVPPDPSGTEGGRPVTLAADYVRDRAAAIALGKALFWDSEIGSDGRTACATCHYQAGADVRIKNQIDPGLAHTNAAVASLFNKPYASAAIPGDVATFATRSGGKGGPNYTVRQGDFPTHVLADPLNRDSAILYTTDDVVGSQGIFYASFVKPNQSRFDDCTVQADGLFQVGGINTRRVTGRNAPTVVNAALNVRNFWDGRANDVFNGFSPFGDRDPDAGIFVTTDSTGVAAKVRLSLVNASAASQAVGPPSNEVEMSCGGRAFADIGRRVLDKQVLSRQTIASTDSVLGAIATGSRPTYRTLIKAAFQPRLWDATQSVSLGGVSYSQIEANFPLFFGLAIQLYESTLISDQTPLDAYLDGNTAALDADQIAGLKLFTGKGRCVNCHGGPELTNAATRLRRQPLERIERMAMADGQAAIYDNGFYNIGVRPTAEDLGVGGKDPWGNPLSFTRQYDTLLQGGKAVDPFGVDVCRFELPLSSADPCDPTLKPAPGFRDAIDGSFKTPTLRNVALTGPYFHNGSRATLEQVVEFYNRGGDRRGSDASNTSGFDNPAANQRNGSNLAPDIAPLNLTPTEAAQLVKFLRFALTDARVAWERAPFDHPSLSLAHGHTGNETKVTPFAKDVPLAQDELMQLKAVGKAGRSAADGALPAFKGAN